MGGDLVKPLPPNPPVYAPPPSQWYMYHEHRGGGPADVFQTLTAMAHFVYDCTGVEYPTTSRKWGPLYMQLFNAFRESTGDESLMYVWRVGCSELRRGDDPENAFLELLKRKGAKRDY